MLAIIKGKDNTHRSQIEFQGLMRGLVMDEVDERTLLVTYRDPQKVLDTVRSVGGTVTAAGSLLVELDKSERFTS